MFETVGAAFIDRRTRVRFASTASVAVIAVSRRPHKSQTSPMASQRASGATGWRPNSSLPLHPSRSAGSPQLRRKRPASAQAWLSSSVGLAAQRAAN